MSVDTRLLQEFIVALTPEEGKAKVNQAFEGIRKNPVGYVGTSMATVFNHIQSKNRDESTAVINGMIMGVWFGYLSQDPSQKKFFEGYLDSYKKSKGENVKDFSTHKARSNKNG